MSSWLLKTFLLNINPCLVLNHALHVFNEILRLDCFIFSNSYAFTCNLLFLLNKNVEENNRFFKCFHVPCNTYYRSSCGEFGDPPYLFDNKTRVGGVLFSNNVKNCILLLPIEEEPHYASYHTYTSQKLCSMHLTIVISEDNFHVVGEK